MNLFELSAKISLDDKASPAIKNTQKNSESLANKIKAMSAQFESAQKNVDKLTQEFSESAKKTGEASKETQDLAKKLDAVEKEAKQAKSSIDRYNNELGEMDSESQSSGGNVIDMLMGVAAASGVAGVALGSVASVVVNTLTSSLQVGAKALQGLANGVISVTRASIEAYGNFEQLSGGAEKIFDGISITQILADAQNAYKTLGLSANQYLAIINDVGATFAATMGDKAGYETARIGLQAISDYASGTGKSVDELSSKFTLITRSTTSYASIADQFSGILPATASAFLEQAQAAGFLKKSYEELGEVPIDEYQSAVARMLEKGVAALGLAGNTAAESASTLTGSIGATKAAWENLLTALAVGNGDSVATSAKAFADSAINSFNLIVERIPIVLNSMSSILSQLFPEIISKIPGFVSGALPQITYLALDLIKQLFIGLNNNKAVIISAISDFLMNTADMFAQMAPEILQIAVEIVSALGVSLGKTSQILIPTIWELLNTITEVMTDNAPLLMVATIELMTGIATGILDSLPLIVDSLFFMWKECFALIDADVIATALQSALRIIVSLGSGILAGIPQIISSFAQLFARVVANFVNQDWQALGVNIVDGLIEGIRRSKTNFEKMIKNLIGGLIGIFRKELDLGSPSRLFKKFGRWTAEGFGIGFDDEFSGVKNDMESALDFDIASSEIAPSMRSVGGGFAYGGTSIGNVSIHIDGAKYADEESLAVAVAEALQNMTDRRTAVYA